MVAVLHSSLKLSPTQTPHQRSCPYEQSGGNGRVLDGFDGSNGGYVSPQFSILQIGRHRDPQPAMQLQYPVISQPKAWEDPISGFVIGSRYDARETPARARIR